MDLQSWTPFFGIACVGLAAACAAALRVRQRAAQALGTRLHVRRANDALRALTLLTLVSASFWLVAAAGEMPPLALGTIVLAAACLALRPDAARAVCGTDGVQIGWTVRSFRELEEWRLVGEHLRFRVGARWLAIELPREHYDATLARLRALAPERESPFR